MKDGYKKFSTGGPTLCGSAEAEARRYKLLIGKSKRRWLVAIQPNEGDNVYAEGGENSDGFGGRLIRFTLEDGSELALVGPWHSNSGGLYDDTGYDCRDKHYIKGIIAEERENFIDGFIYENTYGKILHEDADFVLGTFNRITDMAQDYANKLGKRIWYAYKSMGGGCSGSREPQTTEEHNG
jgi:hypothetical protein